MKFSSEAWFWFRTLAILFFFFLAAYWVWATQGAYPTTTYEKLSDAAAFGDTFGYVNSLLSSLALGGAMVAIILQTLELRNQRIELQESQETWKSQSDAMLLVAYAQLLSNENAFLDGGGDIHIWLLKDSITKKVAQLVTPQTLGEQISNFVESSRLDTISLQIESAKRNLKMASEISKHFLAKGSSEEILANCDLRLQLQSLISLIDGNKNEIQKSQPGTMLAEIEEKFATVASELKRLGV